MLQKIDKRVGPLLGVVSSQDMKSYVGDLCILWRKLVYGDISIHEFCFLYKMKAHGIDVKGFYYASTNNKENLVITYLLDSPHP